MLNADSLPVADDKCAMEPPEHTRFCETLCARDCIVSQWSEWTGCLPDLCRLEAVKSKEGHSYLLFCLFASPNCTRRKYRYRRQTYKKQGEDAYCMWLKLPRNICKLYIFCNIFIFIHHYGRNTRYERKWRCVRGLTSPATANEQMVDALFYSVTFLAYYRSVSCTINEMKWI